MFCAKISKYISDSQALFQECIDLGKEINLKSANLHSAFDNMADRMLKIAELYSVLKIDKNQGLFEKLADVLTGTGENFMNTGELINQFLGSRNMRYHYLENESILELWNLRHEFSLLYCKREKDL